MRASEIWQPAAALGLLAWAVAGRLDIGAADIEALLPAVPVATAKAGTDGALGALGALFDGNVLAMPHRIEEALEDFAALAAARLTVGLAGGHAAGRHLPRVPADAVPLRWKPVPPRPTLRPAAARR